MEQRITFLTLGVQNLEEMKEFYKEKLGWKAMLDNEGIVFFKLNGIVLSLYRADELAEDIGIMNNYNQGFKAITFAINYSSEDEVNKAFDELRAKGVTVVKEPQKAFWGGYSGYISDLENNYWELAHNPFIQMDSAGNIV